jgi:type 1 fimbria pilin
MPNKKNYGRRSIFMKNRLVVFVVLSALSMAVLSCAGGAKPGPNAAFEGDWTGDGLTLTIAGAAATLKEGETVIAKGTIEVTGDTATATCEIADETGTLAAYETPIVLKLTDEKITAEFEGETYTFAKGN